MTEPMLSCENCGTTWTPQGAGMFGTTTGREFICPVCQYVVGSEPMAGSSIQSLDELESQLDALVRRAWASGLDSAKIVDVLRQELLFAAETHNAGHMYAVQVIDLGFKDGELRQRPVRDPRDLMADRHGMV